MTRNPALHPSPARRPRRRSWLARAVDTESAAVARQMTALDAETAAGQRLSLAAVTRALESIRGENARRRQVAPDVDDINLLAADHRSLIERLEHYERNRFNPQHVRRLRSAAKLLSKAHGLLWKPDGQMGLGPVGLIARAAADEGLNPSLVYGWLGSLGGLVEASTAGSGMDDTPPIYRLVRDDIPAVYAARFKSPWHPNLSDKGASHSLLFLRGILCELPPHRRPGLPGVLRLWHRASA